MALWGRYLRMRSFNQVPSPKIAKHKAQETLHFRYLKCLVINLDPWLGMNLFWSHWCGSLCLRHFPPIPWTDTLWIFFMIFAHVGTWKLKWWWNMDHFEGLLLSKHPVENVDFLCGTIEHQNPYLPSSYHQLPFSVSVDATPSLFKTFDHKCPRLKPFRNVPAAPFQYCESWFKYWLWPWWTPKRTVELW